MALLPARRAQLDRGPIIGYPVHIPVTGKPIIGSGPVRVGAAPGGGVTFTPPAPVPGAVTTPSPTATGYILSRPLS